MNTDSQNEQLARSPTTRRVGVVSPPNRSFHSEDGPIHASQSKENRRRKTSGFVMRDLANSLPNVPALQKRKKTSLCHPPPVVVPDSAARKRRRHSFSSPSDVPESVYDFMESMPWLKGASEEFLQHLSLEVHMRPFRKGDIIIRKGDIGRTVFFIVKGTVEVISEDAEVIYAELADGALFGEIAILLDSPRTCTVRAGTTCFLLTLKKDTFQSFLQQELSVKENVMKKAKERLANLQVKVDSGQLEAFGKEFAVASISETLAKIPFFYECDLGFIYQLALGAELKLYQSGETIVEEGTEGTEMYFLIRGVVEAVSKNGTGSRQTLQCGCCFGEVSLLYDMRETRSFKSVTSCDLLVISKATMELVMHDYPHIAEMMKQEVHIENGQPVHVDI